MRPGRSAISARSDCSEMDNDNAESEQDKLQRQLRMMERDQKAHKPKAREHIIRKQEQEIEKLLKEREELNMSPAACKRSSLQRQKTVQSVLALLEQRDVLEEELQKEKRSQKQMKNEMADTDLKMDQVRKGGVSISDTQKMKVQRTHRAIDTLETKLHRAMICLNEQLTKNSQLREELQTLHIERGRFQQLKNRLDKELHDVCKKTEEFGKSAVEAYDAREKAQSKMIMMKEKAVKDLAQYNAEMKELERITAHGCFLEEFMSIKCSERSGQDEGHEMGHRQLSELKNQRRMDSREESPDALEKMFQRIQTVTGDDNLDMLITRFIQVEDQNFALFSFVNEQNNEIERLKDEISQIQAEIEQFQAAGLQQEQDHRFLLRDTDEQLKETESQAEDYENQGSIVSKNLDEIITGVNNVFSKIECDRSVIEDTLGSSTGISENNIMSYLGLVEQKTNELLTIQAFLSPKNQEKDYNPIDLAKFLLGQDPERLQQNISMQPAINSVDYDAEDSSLTDGEERPLSQEELRKRIMNGVLSKESSVQQAATRASEIS